jgi:hypothetical protein
LGLSSSSDPNILLCENGDVYVVLLQKRDF